MELSSSNIKNSYIFSKESFSYISENETLHFSPQAREIKKVHVKKISYTSRNGALKKLLIFSQKKAFLIFRKTETRKQFFIFQETGFS